MDSGSVRAEAMGEGKPGEGAAAAGVRAAEDRGSPAAAAAAGSVVGASSSPPPAGADAGRPPDQLRQCQHIQTMIDISLANLRGLRTQCAASNDLTQQEIRILEAKLVKYISKQLQCKLHVPEKERTAALNTYPRVSDWLYTLGIRKEVIQEIPENLTLDVLLEMNESKVKETMKRCGASRDACSKLNGALICLRKIVKSGGEIREDALWNPSDSRRESGSTPPADFSCPAGVPWLSGLMPQLAKAGSQQPRSASVSAIPSADSLAPGQGPLIYTENLPDPFPAVPHCNRLTLRTPHSLTVTPPTTPQLKRRNKLKPPRTPPPPCRKVLQLLPNFPALTRSKSHESQLGNRIDEVPTLKFGSPQMARRDIGLSVTHRFSTKSWLSQVCHVCHKSMMFGVKCKHCKLKCHNKCTKEAPPCRISFLPIAKIRRTESVPSDINNPMDRPVEPQFGTLPKALTKKDHPPSINHLDSSSNPSSTTSSTPSSPAPFQSSNPPSATTPPNPSPMGQRDSRFYFPEVPTPPPIIQPPEPVEDTNTDEQTEADGPGEHDAEVEEQEANKSEPEYDNDEVDDLPGTRLHCRGMTRKASQTSVYLQEWDIPFEQIELGELIGQGRWGKVYRGRWHGEVAIRLLEIDGNNQDHLKLFKKEVMNYRQTRHENVVLFMGACMHPPHLAIITSFCKGRTLNSFVRDPKMSLDINKTRQIAQEIIKGMGYLHAKGIVHKDLKSKNVFYENGKVVITDFGLFGISGVVQEGRRENELKLPHDWLCYLAPEIVREMSLGKDEDKLPFSKAADVYAFGTVWYELQARDWPFKSQAAEALIWQIGSGEGVKQVLSTISLGKEVTEILSVCWAFDLGERPSFTLLMDMLERLPKLNRRLSHPGHFWKSADISSSSNICPRFERLGLGILEQSNQRI
ncbi:kinase suppressor of Ras 1 isoform X3 [Rhinatrema bivittatum]|uniref:kinase suppressor of Ras 1 isoform X3 n=1 Tax=Rhinatrema bivittatum TaxID=194408 RepID=UPI00112DE6DA|nr:kinase suppressor of Ras 1 isoform X3 [Rhinatrema bivittatum]